ncbi:MAG: Fic family protein [Peptococcaceae bacterium]|nr:Fic family protein [Peptococcaceae bacterium]
MAYETLRKLYYKNNELYKGVYRQRFNDAQTIKLDFDVHDKQAFFIPGVDVLELVVKIERLDKDVRDLSKKLPGVAKNQYSKKCLIDEIVLTNKIEGVYSSRQEIGDVLDALEERSASVKKRERFIGLVQKYLKLINGETIQLAQCQDIRDIYDELVLEEVLAENAKNYPDGQFFRQHETAVYSATDKIIHRGLMPESKIIEAVNKALAFMNNSEVDYLYRICLFHYMIGYIHPFYDGNGRLARFILSYYITEHFEPLLAYRISETIKENIKAYYDAFELCNDPRNLGDLTPFLLMMLNMILQAITELKGALSRKLYRWEQYERLIPEMAGVGAHQNLCELYSRLIQAGLFSERGISMKMLQQTLNLSANTIKGLLEQVSSKGYLVKMKHSKSYYYQINLDLLDKLQFEKEILD